MKIPQTKQYSIYKKLVLQDERSIKFKFINDGRTYYVYRVTDIVTNEYYYGSRIKEKEDIHKDFWSYCTSGKRKKLILEKRDNYKVKILKTFTNSNDMIIYESFLHQYFDVRNHISFWNKCNQGPWSWLNHNMVVTKEQLLVTKEDFDKYEYLGLMNGVTHDIKYNKNMVVTKSGKRIHKKEFDNSKEVGIMKNTFSGLDLEGNKVVVSKNELFNKELYNGYHKDKVVVVDKEGNKFQVNKNDRRYISGELQGHAKGMVTTKDKNGNKYYISINDERYLSGELMNINKGSMPKPHNIKTIEIFDEKII